MEASFFINEILVTFTGDSEIERLLQDDNYAVEYIQDALNNDKLTSYGIQEKDASKLNIERAIDSVDADKSESDEIWNKRGKVNEKDFEGTQYFLTLRASSKYTRLFQDKRSVKLNIWAEIANDMKNAGYFVGEGKLGAQKCRQKFQNLTKNYILFVRHVNSTGKERKDPPEHYELLHAILGDKDKIKLKNIQDSLSSKENKEASTSSSINSDILINEPIINNTENLNNTQIHELIEMEAESANSVEEPKEKQEKNRFIAVKATAKPMKQDIVNIIQSLHKENLEQQSKQFISLHALIQQQNQLLAEQNKQRDRLIDAFVGMTKNKKRRHDDSESE